MRAFLKMIRWSKLLFLLGFAFGLLGTGCGEGGDPGGPRITAFALSGQLPSDKYTAIFALTFSSSDGTLGGGKVNLQISGQTPVSLDMHPLLLAAELPDTAKQGQVAVPLRFSSDSPTNGDSSLTAQLVDSAQRTSNKAFVNLHFQY